MLSFVTPTRSQVTLLIILVLPILNQARMQRGRHRIGGGECDLQAVIGEGAVLRATQGPEAGWSPPAGHLLLRRRTLTL